MVLNKKFIIATFFMIGFIILWRIYLLNNIMMSILLSIIITCSFALLYRKDIKNFVEALKG